MEQPPLPPRFMALRRPEPRRPANRRHTGGQAVVQALVEVDVDTFFLCSGGALIGPLCEALAAHRGARVVRLSQERAAVHAAEGYAKATGRMAAVLVSGASGVAAALPGLMSARADSVPLLCLCGQVASELIGTDAFRECDALGITMPVTKWGRRIASPHDAAGAVARAAQVARDGRCGPVLLEMPIDVQHAGTVWRRVGHAEAGRRLPASPRFAPERRVVHAAAQIQAACRPLFYVGGGLARSGPLASAALAELVHASGIPCALTMTALGALPTGDPHLLGWLGEGGSPVANRALRHADLVVCVGARLDERTWPRGGGPLDPVLPPSCGLVHIDIDPASINKVCPSAVPLVGDCAEVLHSLRRHLLPRLAGPQRAGEAAAADATVPRDLCDWWSQIAQWRMEDDAAAASDRLSLPAEVLLALRGPLAAVRAVVTADDGPPQAAGARHLQHAAVGRWLVSGGVGMPGFALPAAIGALVARPQPAVVCLSDANALLPTLHELQSVADHGWPLKLVVFPSPGVDLRRGVAACAASPAVMLQRPDIAAVARAFGWRIHRLTSTAGLERAVHDCLACNEPCLLQVEPSLADTLRDRHAAPAPAPLSLVRPR